METSKTIDMTKCPYCGSVWIQEESDLYCKDCESQVQADLCLVDMSNSIDQLKQLDPAALKKREPLINDIYEQFTQLLTEI